MSANRASDRVTIAAAPAPSTARAAMSMADEPLTAAQAEAPVNTVMPMRKTRRRPKRSPNAAAGNKSAAKTIV